MDYSKLSDAEVAAKVLIAQGYKLIDDGYGYSIYISDSGRKDIGPKSSKQFLFDPCNNPADAWPIIQKSGISLVYDGDDWLALHFSRTSLTYSNDHRKHPDKPFRAALILWLMMQESE